MAQRYSISSRPDEAAKKRKKSEPVKESKPGLIWAILIIFGVLATGLAIILIIKVLNSNSELKKENADLKGQIEQLKKKVSESNAAANKSSAPATGVDVAKDLAESIQAALGSQNTAALTSRFASSVTVVKAGSSATKQNPTQATASLSYLNGATSPWNWSTQTQYQAGPYGQYFGNNTVTGTSSNGYVVSIGVNSSGQIDTIFMSNNTADVVGSSGQE